MTTLCFHGVGRPGRQLEDGEERFWVSEQQFVDILGVVAGGWPSTILTFDDSNESDVSIALPSLVELGLRAEFFVIAGRVGHPGSLSVGQLRSLTAAGMTIGNHGMHHRPWRSLRAEADFREELEDSRSMLQSWTGTTIAHAACPFGSYDRRVLERLRRAGYTRVYTVDGGSSQTGHWMQPRYTVEVGDTPERISDILSSPDGNVIKAGARSAKKALKRWR